MVHYFNNIVAFMAEHGHANTLPIYHNMIRSTWGVWLKTTASCFVHCMRIYANALGMSWLSPETTRDNKQTLRKRNPDTMEGIHKLVLHYIIHPPGLVPAARSTKMHQAQAHSSLLATSSACISVKQASAQLGTSI